MSQAVGADNDCLLLRGRGGTPSATAAAPAGGSSAAAADAGGPETASMAEHSAASQASHSSWLCALMRYVRAGVMTSISCG